LTLFAAAAAAAIAVAAAQKVDPYNRLDLTGQHEFC
jgi:hypothetical protein